MALITLEAAKRHLQITGTNAYDVDLQECIDALTPMIERHTGPVEPRSVTETVNAYGSLLALPQAPVVSLTSLTPVLTGGTAIDVSEVALDGDAGVLRRLDGGVFAGGPWSAVYVVGRSEVSPTIAYAAKLLLQHLWKTRYGAARGNPGGGDDYDVNEPIPGFGYAMPNRVLEVLEPYKAPPGVA